MHTCVFVYAVYLSMSVRESEVKAEKEDADLLLKVSKTFRLLIYYEHSVRLRVVKLAL